MQKTNKNAIRKDIAALIDGIKASSDRIGFRKDISQAELDLIIHQIEQLYRKSVVFAYLNTLPEDEEAVVVPQVIQQDAKAVPNVVPPVELKSEEKTEHRELEVKIPQEPVITPLQEPVVQEPPAGKEEQQPAMPAPVRPDLKKAIGLNERIMFTRLLFKQDQSAYEAFMAQLSSCASKEEALSLLDMLSSKYGWSKQADEVQTLYTIVKNRF